MRTFVDTLFVVALLTPNDKYHARADAIADAYINGPLLTTDAVLLEIGNSLARQRKAEAVGIITRFLRADNDEIVRLTPDIFDAGFAP